MMLASLALAAWASAQEPAPVTSLKRALTEESRVALFIPFVPQEADFDAGAGGQLMAVAESLAALPQLRLTVEAHVFSLAEPEQNLALSQSRAEAIVRELEALGVARGRLTPKGFGQQRPLVREAKEGYAAGPNERIELFNADYKGLRAYLAVEVQGVERSPGRPLFELMPDYYIARYDEYDSWQGDRATVIGGQILSGRATVVVYRHPDAGDPAAKLPSARRIEADYLAAARQTGGQLVSRQSDSTVFKLESASHEIWIELEVRSGREYIVTILDRSVKRL